MNKLKLSYFQLAFGQRETYLQPELTYERLKRFGYDAIEITPPRGRYGLGIQMEPYLARHKQLTADYRLTVSCINDWWGDEWNPFSPAHLTLTEPRAAELAVTEMRSSIDFAAELGAPFVTVAAALTDASVAERAAVAVDALRRMATYAAQKNVRLVFEASDLPEATRFVNPILNRKRMVELTGCGNIGLQLDRFDIGSQELNPYEAVMDAQPLLWHMHLRDSNSLPPGYGNVDFKAVIRACKKTGYLGYFTLGSAPMMPDADTAARDGIGYVKLLERIVDCQLNHVCDDCAIKL